MDMEYIVRSSEDYGYTQNKLCSIVRVTRRPKGRKIREECTAGFSVCSCMNEISCGIHSNYDSKCICPYGVR